MRNFRDVKRQKVIDLAAKAVIAGDTVEIVSLKNSQLYQDFLQQRVKHLQGKVKDYVSEAVISDVKKFHIEDMATGCDYGPYISKSEKGAIGQWLDDAGYHPTDMNWDNLEKVDNHDEGIIALICERTVTTLTDVGQITAMYESSTTFWNWSL